MRIGENPTKFTRKNIDKASIPVKVPQRITACTVTYIPNFEGYYKEGLDILKMNLAALRKNTALSFDLYVFDNCSCKEATDFLIELNKKNFIQWLCLSSENLKKLGAWNFLLSAAPGDQVYFFDPDIFHYPGWLENMFEVLEAFPEAGYVGSFHNIPGKHLKKNIEIISQLKGVRLEKGFFISKEKLREVGHSLGSDPESFVRKKFETPIYKISRDGVGAYLGASHCQFLARKELLNAIFPRPRNWALKHTDQEFDRLADKLGWLRLTTITSSVYHIGNTLESAWREKAKEYGLETLTNNRVKKEDLHNVIHTLLGFKPIKWIVLRLYSFFFNLLYRIR